MGSFHFGLPDFLLEWAAAEGISSGVETGTLRGRTARAIAEALGSCITIELSDELHAEAAVWLADDPRVTLLHGSSADLLADVGRRLVGPTLFWLDAHYSGDGTAGEGSQCPVLAELDALASLPDRSQHVVCIDDARLFGFVPTVSSGRHDWPSLFIVLSRLEAMGLRTYLVDDVVIGIGPQRVDSFERLFTHPGVRQRVLLFEHWRAIRWWVRLRHRPRLRVLRRRVWKLVRPLVPRSVRRRLKRRLLG